MKQPNGKSLISHYLLVGSLESRPIGKGLIDGAGVGEVIYKAPVPTLRCRVLTDTSANGGATIAPALQRISVECYERIAVYRYRNSGASLPIALESLQYQ